MIRHPMYQQRMTTSSCRVSVNSRSMPRTRRQLEFCFSSTRLNEFFSHSSNLRSRDNTSATRYLEIIFAQYRPETSPLTGCINARLLWCMYTVRCCTAVNFRLIRTHSTSLTIPPCTHKPLVRWRINIQPRW